jgi:hypothetical protein
LHVTKKTRGIDPDQRLYAATNQPNNRVRLPRGVTSGKRYARHACFDRRFDVEGCSGVQPSQLNEEPGVDAVGPVRKTGGFIGPAQ